MSSNTEIALRRILESIHRLSQKAPNQYIEDFQIAEELSLPVEDIKDYLDLLEQRDLIKTANAGNSYSALLNAKGRTFLKDPKFFIDNKEAQPVVFNGNFQGAIISFQSELTHVKQIISSAPNLDDSTKAQFQDLMQKLFGELNNAPGDKADEAEAVLETAKTLADTVSKEKSNKFLVTISAEGLKKAAENLANVMPTILVIANQILALLTK
jgi:hypothetical protein